MTLLSRLETRIGIAPRLAIAFSAVAILAVAANMIAEHGAAVIRTTEVHFLPPPPVEAIPAQVTPVTPVTPVITLDGRALVAAIERFGTAVQSRRDDATPQRVLEFRQASEVLDRESAEFLSAAGKARVSGPLRELRKQLPAHRQEATRLLKQADEQRRLLETYRSTFENIDARIKGALDGAWKILGRVVARQSLVDMSRSLDQMRPFVAGLGLPETVPVNLYEALAAEEAEFGRNLAKASAGLARSQGEPWLVATLEHLATLAEARTALETAGQAEATEIQRFGAANRELATLVPAIRPIPTPVPATPVESAVAVDDADGPEEAAVEDPVPETLSTTETFVNPEAGEARVLIGWLSAAVLLLLLFISVGTAVSILRPVRTLMTATRRIADGETGVVVPRGGIRELDALAVSFNSMAERLAAAQALAREYHGELESKVEERTRQLQHLAGHDPLTQLPNRRQLFAQLKTLLESAASDGMRVGVYFIDLDNFKNINDSMGHVFGDRVLWAFAKRLEQVSRPFGRAARLGGDEFTVIHDRAGSAEEIVAAGQALVAAFEAPLEVDGRELSMSISVGASIYPDHETDAESLLRAADAALFRAKALGRSQLCVFSSELFDAAAARFTTEQGLRRAIERDEFKLYFQPEVNAATGEADLVEALMRWQLPGGQCVTPDQFLTVAEECGLIGQISDWVIRSAVATAARWRHGDWPEVRVAINLSPRQLLDSDFVENLLETLAQHDLPARCIEIELTENVLQTGAGTIESLRRLRRAGFGIALDDFGTGYSSLVSLEQLPLTRVKLDKTLIASIDSSPRSLAIASAIIGLCQGLGLEITAEGVERPQQLGPLMRHRGMYIQGYLLSQAVPASELLAARAEMPARWRDVRAAREQNRPLLTSVGS